jgi:hypothetical protein
VLVKVEALELCRVLNGPRFYTAAELFESVLACNIQDRVGFEAGLAYAKERGWIRPAHLLPHLTLTSTGLAACSAN